MKRIVTFVVTLCILISISNIATFAMDESEEFSIRNGIKWGMSEEEILAAETQATFKKTEDFNDYAYRIVRYKDAKVSFFDNVDLNYQIVDDKLMSLYYAVFVDFNDNDSAIFYDKLDAFNIIIAEKYGVGRPANKFDIERCFLSINDRFKWSKPEYYTPLTIWNLQDGTIVIEFFYKDDFFNQGYLYINYYCPELGISLFSTDGL